MNTIEQAMERILAQGLTPEQKARLIAIKKHKLSIEPTVHINEWKKLQNKYKKVLKINDY